MKTGISNLIKFCLFTCLTIFLVLKVGIVFIPETNVRNIQGQTYTIKGYYKLKKNTIDVLFLGDSSMLRAISPMEMWKSDGITSYNYSVNSVRMYGTYYLLKDALKTQKPKVVVIDPVTVFYKWNNAEELQRISMDYLDNSLTKLEMINNPNFKNTFEDKVSYIFPLLRYHSRWNEMKINEIEKLTRDYTSATRGFVMSWAVKPNKSGNSYMEKLDQTKTFENNSEEYMLKINELCKKNGIKLLILGIQDTKVWGKQQTILIKEFAEKNDIDLLDLNTVDYGINWDEDTKDGGVHLNILGALKTTNYLTGYLKENYELEDHRDDKKYNDWNEDYQIYKKELDRFVQLAYKQIKKNANNTK